MLVLRILGLLVVWMVVLFFWAMMRTWDWCLWRCQVGQRGAMSYRQLEQFLICLCVVGALGLAYVHFFW